MTSSNRTDSLIGARYRIERLLGTGGMASVYLARDDVLDRPVAVKVLHSHYAADEQFVQRFEREATAIASLNHPNIVQVHDRGQQDGDYFIVMEYIDGPTLKELAQSEKPMDEQRAVNLVAQAARGLGHAHDRDVVHRDIKPHNLLLDKHDRVKIADFGIARAATHIGHTITAVGSVVGTPHYLSPEQAQGEAVTPASDVYSLGVVLFEMLTGRVPFDGDRPLDIVFQHVNNTPPELCSIRPDISPATAAIVSRAMSKDPRSRYGNGSEFAHAIEQRGHHADTAATVVLPMVLDRTTVLAHATRTMVVRGTKRASDRWRRLSPRIRTLAIATLAAVAASAMFGLAAQADDVPAPRLDRSTQAQAIAQLEDSGLRVGTIEHRFSSEPAGTVLDQNPGPGDGADPGSPVDLVISKGPRTVATPNVTGGELGQAHAAARAAGMTLVVTNTQHHESAPQNTIISQTPEPGRMLPRGSAINVIVSAGPRPYGDDEDDEKEKKGKGREKEEREEEEDDD